LRTGGGVHRLRAMGGSTPAATDSEETVMRTSRLRHIARRAVVPAFAALTSIAAVAADTAPVRLTMLSDRYVVGTQALPDLAAVDRWTREHTLRVTAIDRCPSATTHRFLATVERYATFGAEAIEVRSVPAGVAGCTDETSSLAGWLRAQDYTQTDENGRSIMP